MSLLDRQQAFGYTQEDTKLLMSPMATTGQEAVGSMGTDTPISAMSDKSKLLYTYFKQNFAQVTNPPIDPIREELVMSLVSFIGPRPNIFDLVGASRKQAAGSAPADPDQWRSREDPLHRPHRGPLRHQDDRHHLCRRPRARPAWPARIERLCERAEAAVAGGYNIIILSDRQVGPDRIAIPALLATAAVHHHLIRKGLRTSVGLVVESGEPREVHHFCCLAGYGAEAINPYLAFDTLLDMHKRGEFPDEVDAYEVVYALHQVDRQGHPQGHVQDGHLDLPVLLRRADLRRRRPADATSSSTTSPAPRRMIEGVGLDEIAAETVSRHTRRLRRRSGAAQRARCRRRIRLPHARRGACLVARRGGDLQHAVRGKARGRRYQASSPRRSTRDDAVRMTIRGLFRIKHGRGDRPHAGAARRGRAGGRHRQALLDRRHVASARSAARRIRRWRIAMNRIGGKSNTGEGGEEPDRYLPLPDGGANPERSAIKQVASGRFGVTAEYLVNCRHDADQGRAGRQARRGRPAARPQGRRDHRQDAPFDAGRRPDLAAAASRHLFDRGSGAADLRPEERQPGGRRLGQAGLGSRRRHGCGRRRQGARRPHHHLRL